MGNLGPPELLILLVFVAIPVALVWLLVKAIRK